MTALATAAARVVPLGEATAVAAIEAAAVFSSDVERPEGAELAALKPPNEVSSGRLEKGVMRFYGAVGGTLCATLWDPGSSINMITPEFAHVKDKSARLAKEVHVC